MKDTVPAEQVADLLAAICEALTAPDPAGPYDVYEQHVSTRAAWIRGVLKSSTGGNLGDVAATAQAIRAAAQHVPVRYEIAREGEGK